MKIRMKTILCAGVLGLVGMLPASAGDLDDAPKPWRKTAVYIAQAAQWQASLRLPAPSNDRILRVDHIEIELSQGTVRSCEIVGTWAGRTVVRSIPISVPGGSRLASPLLLTDGSPTIRCERNRSLDPLTVKATVSGALLARL